MKFASFTCYSFKNTQLLLGSVASVGARVTTVASMLVITAIAARMMTKEEFGLWTILVTFIYLSRALDLGFRYGMGNRLAALVASAGGRSTAEQRELYLSIFFFTFVVGIFLSLIYLTFETFLPWAGIFKIQQAEIVSDVHLLILIALISLFISIPFTLMGTGFFAFQEVNLSCFITAAQSILLLILFWITSLFFTFKWVIICYFLAYLLTNGLSTVWFLMKRGWPLVWIPLTSQYKHLKSVSSRSLEFFVQSSVGIFISNISLFLASNVAGLSKAGDFSLVQKIFGLMITVHLALLAPLAPLYTQKAHLNDWEFVRSKLSYCKRIIWPSLFIVGGGAIYLFHPIILYIWAGRDLSDYTLAGLIALQAILSGWINTQSVLLNSLGLVKWQAIAFVVQAPIFIFLPLYFGKYWGITGVALGTLLCMIPGAFIWPLYANYSLRLRLLKV
jgi:O-antigen/teichoic acid export membrane protein